MIRFLMRYKINYLFFCFVATSNIEGLFTKLFAVVDFSLSEFLKELKCMPVQFESTFESVL